MAEMLEYCQPIFRRGGLLTVAVALSWVYPLLVVASLHAEWLIHRHVLGHPPRMDDPYVLPFWVQRLDGIILIGSIPIFAVAVCLNLLHARIKRPPARALWLQAAAWGGLLAVLLIDPVGALRWWFD